MLSEIQYLNNIQLSYKPQCTCNQESTGVFDILMLSLLQASKKYNVDEKLIRSEIKIESNFDPTVVSFTGATGLM